MEITDRPHKSYIAVSIPGGKQNYNDKSTSTLIIRCINKKAGPNRTLTELFSVDDKHLLNYVGAILESFQKVIEVLYERNDLIDLIIHETENPILGIRGILDTIKHKRTNRTLTEERLDEKLKEIDILSLLLKGWMSNMDFLNQLMQGKQLQINREEALLWHDIIKHTIYGMTPKLVIFGLNAKEIKGKNIERNLVINADNDHLKQVFYNLIVNALKYKKLNQNPDITIEFEEREEETAVKIIDWGVGVKVEHKEKIFERGFRSRYARKHNVKGKGFGLWLCKEFLESNGLKIYLSKCKDPTVFEVIIPNKFISYGRKRRQNDYNV
jgi:signal transduction histidine kinase